MAKWTWKALTQLPEPDKKPRKPRTPKDGKNPTTPKEFPDSVLGKLSQSVAGLHGFSLVDGIFVSNAGCMVPLQGQPSNAAAAQECSLEKLAIEHSKLLDQALAGFPDEKGDALKRERLHLYKTPVNPDLPEELAVAVANDILSSRLASHAAQSRPLVRTLFAAVSGKGRHTGALNDLNDLCTKRGFSKKDVQEAFAALESVPDLTTLRNAWLAVAAKDGMPLIEHGRLSIEVGKLAVNKLTGIAEETSLQNAARAWVKDNPPVAAVLPFLESGSQYLLMTFPSARKEVLQAHLLMEGVLLCADPISEN